MRAAGVDLRSSVKWMSGSSVSKDVMLDGCLFVNVVFGEHHVEGVISQFGSRVIQGMLVCQKKIKKLSLLLLSLAGQL